MTSKPTKQDEPESLGTFDKCPCCGGTDFLMKSLVEEAIKKGKISEETVACLQPMSALIIGPKDLMVMLVPKMVDVGMAITDSCKTCGAIFSTQHLKGKQMMAPGQGMGMPSMGMPGM